MKNFFQNFFQTLDRSLGQCSRIVLVAAAIGFVLVVGMNRCLTGSEYALSVFFMFPIVLITWYVGIIAGISMAVFSTATWLVADLWLLKEFSTPLVPFINEFFRLVVFVFVVLVVGSLKTALETQKKIARTDTLTALANRLAFFEAAEKEIHRARRFNDPVSIVYIDIDNFKLVNDSRGHAAGDRLLQATAKIIVENIREIDLAARIGGDEIGLLLVKTNVSGAVTLAEKLKTRLDDQMRRKNWPVTFSMGVATFPKINASVGDMMNVADRLMYAAKHQGKNRIVQEIFIGHPEAPVAGSKEMILKHSA